MRISLSESKQRAKIEGLDVGSVGKAFCFNDWYDLLDVDFRAEGFVFVSRVELRFDVDPYLGVSVADYEVEHFFEGCDACGGVNWRSVSMLVGYLEGANGPSCSGCSINCKPQCIVFTCARVRFAMNCPT